MSSKLARLLIGVSGLAFLVAGPFAISQGASAKGKVRATLRAEHIVTAKDASMPGRLIDTAAEAESQADIIAKHAAEATGGKTYAQMGREDPKRVVAFNGAALRTSLMTSVLAFGVSDLVIGIGAFITAVGLALLALAYVTQHETHVLMAGVQRETVNA